MGLDTGNLVVEDLEFTVNLLKDAQCILETDVNITFVQHNIEVNLYK